MNLNLNINIDTSNMTALNRPVTSLLPRESTSNSRALPIQYFIGLRIIDEEGRRRIKPAQRLYLAGRAQAVSPV